MASVEPAAAAFHQGHPNSPAGDEAAASQPPSSRSSPSSPFAQLAALIRGESSELLPLDADFLPGDPDEDGVPAITMVEGHLGIGMWALPSIYNDAKKALAAATVAAAVAASGRTESSVPAVTVGAATARAGSNRGLNSGGRDIGTSLGSSDGGAWDADGDADGARDKCTRVLLLIGADSNSLWNRRKEALDARLAPLRRGGRLHRRRRRHPSSPSSSGTTARFHPAKVRDPFIKLLSAELAFGALVLTKHPKSAETWAHRGWVLRQLLADLTDWTAPPSSSSSSRTLPSSASVTAATTAAAAAAAQTLEHYEALARELDVCQAAAERYPRCYYAWVHRLQVCVCVCVSARVCACAIFCVFDWNAAAGAAAAAAAPAAAAAAGRMLLSPQS